MNTITIGYSPDYLKWEGSHASPQRARLAVQHILARGEAEKVDIDIIEPTFDTGIIRRALSLVHSKGYIRRILSGHDGEWSGVKPSQGRTAALMFEGTRVLAEQIVETDFAPRVYFNPQGAKHHAGYNASSGFCVFNDMAWAAQWFAAMGKKVAYLDWDVHHGDGVEDLTRTNKAIMTVSIHQWGIFPGTGMRCQWKNNVFNYPLANAEGDNEFHEALDIALEVIKDFGPDVFLLACGADGLAPDPLGGLRYSIAGLTAAAHKVGKLANELAIPVLIGGAGGYTPFTYTPVAWAETVWAINEELSKGQPLELSADDFDWGDREIVYDDSEEETEEDSRRAHIDQIMDQLKDFTPDQWEDLLTREEYDLVESRIAPAILDYHNQLERRRSQRSNKKGSRR